MHVDNNNLGASAFVAIGDYTGGELWLHGRGALDAHYKWHIFDGNVAHCTLPWKGNRFSFVFFTQTSHAKCPFAERLFVTATLGFPWPKRHAVMRKRYGSVEKRIKAAMKEYRAWTAKQDAAE